MRYPRSMARSNAGTKGVPRLEREDLLELTELIEAAPTAVHRMQRAFAQRQPVRPIADSAHARRQLMGTSSSLIDFVYHEALVLLAIGDTAVAVQRLDEALGGLGTASPTLLSDVHRAAAIPAAMLLRARLAARARDDAVARRWAQAAVGLWGGADAELVRLLDEVRPFTVDRR